MWVLVLFAGGSNGIDGMDTTSVSPARARRKMEANGRFAQPRIDLYGNEIRGAVGDYRVDPRGDLYERHAPDTAVLKLGSPGV